MNDSKKPSNGKGRKRAPRAVTRATSVPSAGGGALEGSSTQIKLAKLSVTIPQQAADAARDRAGSRGLSAYIANAVEQQLRRDALADWVRDIERQHGRVPDDDVTRAREILLGESE